jgi:hypothetical protein
VSTTLPESEATWENTRVARDPGEAVAALKAEPGRDILAPTVVFHPPHTREHAPRH